MPLLNIKTDIFVPYKKLLDMGHSFITAFLQLYRFLWCDISFLSWNLIPHEAENFVSSYRADLEIQEKHFSSSLLLGRREMWISQVRLEQRWWTYDMHVKGDTQQRFGGMSPTPDNNTFQNHSSHFLPKLFSSSNYPLNILLSWKVSIGAYSQFSVLFSSY